MTGLFLPLLGVLILLGSLAHAKGRKPAGREQGFEWDDSRVKRGSPANPNSAYQPPQIGYTLPETRDDTEKRTEKKASRAPSKKESQAAQENWTFEDNATKSTPVKPSVAPEPKTTLESGEQALPEYSTEDPYEKPKK